MIRLRSNNREQAKIDRQAELQLQVEAKEAEKASKTPRKQAPRRNIKKSLVVVLKYRIDVTWRDIDNIGTLVKEHPP